MKTIFPYIKMIKAYVLLGNTIKGYFIFGGAIALINNITLMIGGIQGEGVVSTGNILIKALSRLGYFTYGFRNFSSRIKGGHTNYIIEIATKKILACSDKLDILVATDMETVEVNIEKLKEGGLLLYDSIIDPKGYFVDEDFKAISFPFTNIAKQHGSYIMKNTAIVAFITKLLGISIDAIENIIREIYEKKGEATIEKNLLVFEKAIKVYEESMKGYRSYTLNKGSVNKMASMIGNEALALGALMAGCRFVPSYPITPASEILEYMAKHLPDYNGVVIQTEDEISAVTMAIGGAYAGARTMTASSGPGLSLMMEGIGLAGMAEIPIVVLDVQRVGPSTGLPTKHEQSDLQFLYNSSHGEIPLIIISPYSVEECFYQSIEAFNLAEKYQCPVIILSDLALGLSIQTIEDLNKDKIVIDRGKLISKNDINELQHDFKRFDFTEDNISPRTIPGVSGGIHKVTGLEHSLIGTPNNDSEIRKKMMDKRLNKVKELESIDGVNLWENQNSELLILSMGSGYGIIKKVIEDNNLPVSYGVFKRIKPLPTKQLDNLFEKYSKILILENNATAQLASIIKQSIDSHNKITSLLKYNGMPFELNEVKSKIEELI